MLFFANVSGALEATLAPFQNMNMSCYHFLRRQSCQSPGKPVRKLIWFRPLRFSTGAGFVASDDYHVQVAPPFANSTHAWKYE